VNMHRTERIGVALTRAEKKLILRIAKREGKEPGSWSREVLLTIAANALTNRAWRLISLAGSTKTEAQLNAQNDAEAAAAHALASAAITERKLGEGAIPVTVEIRS